MWILFWVHKCEYRVQQPTSFRPDLACHPKLFSPPGLAHPICCMPNTEWQSRLPSPCANPSSSAMMISSPNIQPLCPKRFLMPALECGWRKKNWVTFLATLCLEGWQWNFSVCRVITTCVKACSGIYSRFIWQNKTKRKGHLRIIDLLKYFFDN